MASGDDLYVNAGDSYDTDTTYYADTKMKVPEADKEQIAAQAASYPIMEKVAEWFEEQIASCDSIDNIQIDSFKVGDVKVERQVGIEAQVLAMRLLKGKLMDKFADFKRFSKKDESNE